MGISTPTSVSKKSILVPTHVDVSAFAVASVSPSSSTFQGRTTHFNSNFSNGLLTHQPGNLCLLKTESDWRQSWSIITPGNFSGRAWSDLLFYDPGAGTGEFYTTEGGNIRLLKTQTGWRSSWTIIVPCNLTGGAH